MNLQDAAKFQLGYGRLIEQVPADEEFKFDYGQNLAVFRASKHMQNPNAEYGALTNNDSVISKYVVIVLPGGGYEFVSYLEDRKVALAFAERGFDAVVLRYHTKYVEDVLFSGKGVGHEAMVDVAQLIDELRHNPKMGMQDHKIILCGFSAGGHLAASMCTLYNSPDLVNCAAWRGSLRPDGAILCYPVISTRKDLAHQTTFTCFTGSADPEKWQPYSCECNVTADTPPAYIWHTATDQAVAYGNSIAYAQAMWDHGNLAQLVIFPKGEHGSSLATDDTDVSPHFFLANPNIATWLDQAVTFVRNNI